MKVCWQLRLSAIRCLMLGLLACQSRLLPPQVDPVQPKPLNHAQRDRRPIPERPLLEQAAPPSLGIASGTLQARLTYLDIWLLRWQTTPLLDQWFGLAGLGKTPQPAEFPTSLQAYRTAWRTVNPDVASFLGLWHYQGEPFGQIDWLNIFPSHQGSKVCILEGQWDSDSGLSSHLYFSTAQVTKRQMQGSRIRSAQSMVWSRDYAPGHTVEVISVLDAQNKPRIFAAQSTPDYSSVVPKALHQQVAQKLWQEHCTKTYPMPTNVSPENSSE